MDINLDKTLDEVKKLAQAIGSFQAEESKKNNFSISKKTSDIDLVTEIDKLSETKIIDKIKNKFPEHSILAEEGGSVNKDSLYTWIIDPLDGTNNYANGYPLYCVSIALEYKNEIILGVVFVPELNQLFWAAKDQGAYLNGKKLKVSQESALNQSLLATGFPYDKLTSKYNNIDHFQKIIMKVRGVRRSGSAAFDLSNVANGSLDGFWEFKLKPWDVAAAKIFIKEAGGTVIEETWGDASLIVAGNPKICDKIYDLLKEI